MKRTLAIALVVVASVAAAGTAYAAIPSSDGVISACKSKDGAIKLIDVEKGQGCPGSQQLIQWNQQGPAGQDGADGQDGAGGVSGYEIVSAQSALTSLYDKTVSAWCPAGKVATGGGGGVFGEELQGGGQVIVDGVGIVQSLPSSTVGWSVRAQEFVSTSTVWRLHVWVVCVNAS